jgi:hypothetical protein
MEIAEEDEPNIVATKLVSYLLAFGMNMNMNEEEMNI